MIKHYLRDFSFSHYQEFRKDAAPKNCSNIEVVNFIARKL